MLCFHISYAYEVWKLLFLGKMSINVVHVCLRLFIVRLDFSRCLLDVFSSDSRAIPELRNLCLERAILRSFSSLTLPECQLLSRIP
jgi:hypothetical protein